MTINFLSLRTSLLVPLVLSALTSLGQVVTDPSNTPGYDAAKLHGAATSGQNRAAAGPTLATQQQVRAATKQMPGISSSVMAVGSNCFIPLDNTYLDVPINDDGSLGPIPLPFTFDLYGSQYNQVWINTNGNLTFAGPYSAFTASGFPFSEPMVAAFWADEDTRSGGRIHYKLNPTNLIVTWDGVGYFAQHTDKLNTFQIIIGTTNDALLGPGQNVSFRYGDMQWTTGDASGGANGFGGVPATVGVNNGNNTDFVQVGRFDQSGTTYDGPGGNSDGVDYLDGQCFGFNVSTAGNIPPSANNLPAGNTVTVACGQTVTINPQFLAPEINQTVNVAVNLNGLCNTTATTTNGVTASAAIVITGAACNIGSNLITLTATDNGSPVGVTTVTLNVVVTPCTTNPCNPSANTPVAGTDQFTAACGPLTVTAAQLLANDTSPNATPLTIGSVSGGAGGNVVDNGDGTYTFTPFPNYNGPAFFTYLLQSAGAIFPNPGTGHYYELVDADDICWDAAKTAAAGMSYAGMTGYLATPTSQQEADYLANRKMGNYWLGGTDEAVEGTWLWATGPETGQVFYTGGATAPGSFSNWSYGEPNDYKNVWRPIGEDYLHMYAGSGQWNDLSNCAGGSRAAGYVVEYGGLAGECLPVLYATGTVNITVTNSGMGTSSLTANPDNASTAIGTPVTVTAAQLMGNDTDTQNRALRISSVSGGVNGNVVNNGNNTFTFTPNFGYQGPATFNYLLQLDGPVLALAATGHYYEFVNTQNLCWNQAKTAAAARTYNGLQGYLATLTRVEENNLLKGINPDNIWFGASDAAVEGEWRWATGPEAGQLFYVGNGSAGGAAVPGQYSNWSPNEPNNFVNQFRPGGEHYAHMYGNSGLWNDLSDCAGGSGTAGYFVEYGGLEQCTPTLFAVGTVTVNVGGNASRNASNASANSAKAVLQVAPNPTSGQFNVRVIPTMDGTAQLDLYDLQGRKVQGLFTGTVLAGEVRDVQVNGGELSSGLYMVRLQTAQGVQNLRVVLQK